MNGKIPLLVESLEPVLGLVSLEPVLGLESLEPVLGLVSLEPVLGLVSLEPVLGLPLVDGIVPIAINMPGRHLKIRKKDIAPVFHVPNNCIFNRLIFREIRRG
eukprot:GHVO01063001.1.p2 GENE.GHVO01063001.1~~GHVO01063001.1.p2  ORF type:complete len:103 (+),score=31.46 GHVO01063001.1:283-591(+)